MQMSSGVIPQVPGNTYCNIAHIPCATSKDKGKGSRGGRGGEREDAQRECVSMYVQASGNYMYLQKGDVKVFQTKHTKRVY